jgi:hypothetical protein
MIINNRYNIELRLLTDWRRSFKFIGNAAKFIDSFGIKFNVKIRIRNDCLPYRGI